MKSRKLTMIVLAAALVVPGVLLAQGPGNGEGPPDGPPGAAAGQGPGQGQGPGIRELLPPPGYLQLTDGQKEAAKGLAEDLRAALEPIGEELRAKREALRDAVESDDPKAAEIGQLVLDVRALEGQVRDEIQAAGDAFRDLLDTDQQLKYDHFLELRRLQAQRGGPGAKSLGARRAHRFG